MKREDQLIKEPHPLYDREHREKIVSKKRSGHVIQCGDLQLTAVLIVKENTLLTTLSLSLFLSLSL